MPVDLSSLPLDAVSPSLMFFGAALALAALACLVLMFSGGGIRRKLKDAEDAARGLRAEIKSLSGERDTLKTDHGLAEQNFRFIAEKIGLDSFSSDEEKKNFIDAVGSFARQGEIDGLLKVRQVNLNSALGMSGEELSGLMTFRNHIDPEWVRQPAKAAKSLEVLAARLAAIGQMESVWTDKTATVADAREVLAANMWLFEPDYVVSKGQLFVDRTIGSIMGEGQSTSNLRPDIVAKAALSASLQSGHQWRDIHRTGILIVDLKGTGTRIGLDEMQKAASYGRELLRAQKSAWAKATTAVDCFVVGKEVDEEEGTPRAEGWSGNIRIVALSYDQLIARAKRMTLDLARLLAQTPERYDDKVHMMPSPEPAQAESMAADAHDEEHHEEHREESGGDRDRDGGHEGELGPDGKPVKASDPHANGADDHGRESGHHDDHHGEHHADPTGRRMAAE